MVWIATRTATPALPTLWQTPATQRLLVWPCEEWIHERQADHLGISLHLAYPEPEILQVAFQHVSREDSADTGLVRPRFERHIERRQADALACALDAPLLDEGDQRIRGGEPLVASTFAIDWQIELAPLS